MITVALHFECRHDYGLDKDLICFCLGPGFACFSYLGGDLDMSEESRGGLLCVLKTKCHKLLLQQKHARTLYQQGVLGQGTDTIVLDTSDEDSEGRDDSSDEEADT